MKRKKLLVLLLAAAMAMTTVAAPAFADDEVVEETVVEETETAEEQPEEEQAEEQPAEAQEEQPAEEAEGTEEITEEAAPEEAAEEQPVEESAEVTEETAVATDEVGDAGKCLVQTSYGYQFQDGSFDNWLSGTAIYVGNGYLISSTNAVSFAGDTDERYQAALVEKRDTYSRVGVTLSSYGNNTKSFVLYVITPDGKAVQASVVATNTSGLAILQTSLTNEDVEPAALYSDTTTRQAAVAGYNTYASQALSAFVGSSKAYTPASPARSLVGILTRNGIVSITGTVDPAMLGGAVIDGEGHVIGLVTDINGEESTGISAESFASDLAREAGISVEGSEASNLANAKTALASLIESLSAADISNYTEESQSAFSEVLADANEVLENDESTVDDYNAAASSLQNAYDALEEIEVTPFLQTTTGMILIVAIIVVFALLIYLLRLRNKRKKEDENYDWVEGEEMDRPEDVRKAKKAPKVKAKAAKPEKKAEQHDPYAAEEPGTTILEQEEGTTILGMDSNPAKLIDLKTGAAIRISSMNFVIGKSKKEPLGYRIADDTSISRKHAEISYENGNYYVTDLDSLNGTFVNNARIEAQQKTPIHDGDKLRLSDKNYVFHTK